MSLPATDWLAVICWLQCLQENSIGALVSSAGGLIFTPSGEKPPGFRLEPAMAAVGEWARGAETAGGICIRVAVCPARRLGILIRVLQCGQDNSRPEPASSAIRFLPHASHWKKMSGIFDLNQRVLLYDKMATKEKRPADRL
jgi:hypothetical protein